MSTRVYTVTASRAGGRVWVFWPPREYTTRMRIREVSLRLFRQIFGGLSPDALCWHKNGFMAECNDKRGNCITVEQYNSQDPFVIECERRRAEEDAKRYWLVGPVARKEAA